MTRLVLLGAGGTSRDLADFVEEINRATPRYECLGFLDDDPALRGTRISGLEVLGPLARVADLEDVRFVDGLGSPSNFWRREEIIRRLELDASRWETIVHPSARVSASSRLGPGCVVYPQAVILSNATLGEHVTVLANTVVNHDTAVGDYTILASGVNVSGGVRIGRSCYLGSGSAVIQGAAIGDRCMLGMGSTLLGDLPANRVAVGSPARFLRHTVPEAPAEL